MHTKSILAVLAATVVLFIGCHSAPSTPPGPAVHVSSLIPPDYVPTQESVPDVDACAMLSPAEVDEVVGTSIGPGKHINPTIKSMCKWSESGASAETEPKAILNFTSLGSVEREKKPAPAILALTALNGVGDEAFYVTTRFGISLYVRKGNTAFVVGEHESLPPEQLKSREKALALKAVAKV